MNKLAHPHLWHFAGALTPVMYDFICMKCSVYISIDEKEFKGITVLNLKSYYQEYFIKLPKLPHYSYTLNTDTHTKYLCNMSDSEYNMKELLK